jgi:hypothetical protein
MGILKKPKLIKNLVSEETKFKVKEMFLINKSMKDMMVETNLSYAKIRRILNEVLPDREISEKLKIKYCKIADMYLSGMLTEDIAKEMNISLANIYYALDRLRIPYRQPHQILQILDKIHKNSPKVKVLTEISKSKKSTHTVYICECIKCKKEVKIQLARYKKIYLDKDKLIYCDKCDKLVNGNDRSSAKPKTKANTSGYIGVCAHTRKQVAYGVKVELIYKGTKLINKVFADNTLSEKTFIMAAVIREKYIIENNLPHTRNFSDQELISNMERLGEYSEIGKFQKILNEGK